jgi:hypothetical protein
LCWRLNPRRPFSSWHHSKFSVVPW